MKVSVIELIAKGKWEEICKAKHLCPWTYNSGVLPASIELTDEEGLQFGLWATQNQMAERPDETYPIIGS